jgi:ribosomal protein S18 acetylase RimI-like enzyme
MHSDAEAVEAEFMYQYETNAPASLDVTAGRLRGGVVLHMRHDPIHYWTKALGFTDVATPDLVDQVLDFYRSQSASSATLQFAPDLLPDDFPQIAATRRLAEAGSLVKLGCEVREIPPVATGFRIARVAEDNAAAWGELIMTSFGAPGTPLSQMIANSVTQPGFQPFAAWDGTTMVAGGNLFVHGDVASLNTGGTLPAYRGRGAQSALIAALMNAARETGCRWVFAETGLPSPGEGNSSLNNLRRAGLEVLYYRQNWRWIREEHAGNR